MLLLFTAGAFAQQYGEGTQHIGFTAGFNNLTLRERSFSYNELQKNASQKGKMFDQNTALHGFSLGFVYETSIVKGFGLQLGLNYSFGANLGKNLGGNNAGTAFKKKEDFFIHEIEIPIDWQYKFEVAKQTYLIVYTGPTFQTGFGFNHKVSQQRVNPTTGKYETIVTTNNFYKQYNTDGSLQDYDADKKADNLRRLNLTWGVGAGFQYQNYYLRGGYDFGIYNPYCDKYDDLHNYRYRGRLDQWSIKLGIYFLNF